MVIVLVGYMGSGKSAIGKSLAAKLRMPFTDLDDYIVAHEALSIPEIFRQKGEIYFRRKEAEYVEQLLTKTEARVVALGGGTPCFGNTMDYVNGLENIMTIYLDTGRETLVNRLFLEKDRRPMISHLETKEALDDFIRKHLFERAFYYNQSQYKFVTDHKSIEEITIGLVSILNTAEAGKR